MTLETVTGSRDKGRNKKKDIENYTTAVAARAAAAAVESYDKMPVSQRRMTIAN